MTVFDRPITRVTMEELAEMLGDSEGEALLWEAKGTELQKGSILKAVCAFANSQEGGLLILGAESDDGQWNLSGFDFPDEPKVWISNVISNGMRPIPDFDINDYPVGEGQRKVAVVEVQPLSTPPCITGGTVYERVPGKSIKVQDPNRLADLYARGRHAHIEARSRADDMCNELIDHDQGYEGRDTNHLHFSLAITSTDLPPDLSSKLFSESFQRSITLVFRDHLLPSQSMPDPLRPIVREHVTQSSMIVVAMDQSYMGLKRHWWCQVRWDGTVGVHYWTGNEPIEIGNLVADPIKAALGVACELLGELGGKGDRYLSLRINGGEALKRSDRTHLSVSLGRGPATDLVGNESIASIGREIARSVGLPAFEPAGGYGEAKRQPD